MPYQLDDAISAFLPPSVISAEPLDFDWDEAVNAVVFTSAFDSKDFASWAKTLTEHYDRLVAGRMKVDPEIQADIGCIHLWLLKLDPAVDICFASRHHPESFANLNAWIGSNRFRSLFTRDTRQPWHGAHSTILIDTNVAVNNGMNAGAAITRFQMEHRPRRPGYANRSPQHDECNIPSSLRLSTI